MNKEFSARKPNQKPCQEYVKQSDCLLLYTFAGESIIGNPVGAMFLNNGFQAFQGPAFEVHVKTPSLKHSKFEIRQQTVVVLITYFEYSS